MHPIYSGLKAIEVLVLRSEPETKLALERALAESPRPGMPQFTHFSCGFYAHGEPSAATGVVYRVIAGIRDDCGVVLEFVV